MMSQSRLGPYILGVCSGIFLHKEYPKEIQTMLPIIKQWAVSMRAWLDNATK